jgi:hypothetical protein
MRDLVPRKSPIKKNTVTPWSTYIHVTPIKLPKRPSLSPSPVAHSKSPMVMSPIALSPTMRPVGQEESSCTLSIGEYPHESTQLPRRPRAMKKARPAIDVIEEFIKDLPPKDKEGVRMTYNGPDWPGYLERFQRDRQPRLSLVPDMTRQSIATSYGGHNRFLVGLPSLTPPPVHVPQVVYHYFPRGC